MSEPSSPREIEEAMITFGGSFVAQLGRLFRLADSVNHERLRDAFADYWRKYDHIARETRERRQAAR